MSTPRMPVVGLIGCGIMGRPIAECFFRAGQKLAIFDIDPAATAGFNAASFENCTSPADVADRAEMVLSCLPSTAAFDACAFGERGLIRGGAIKIYVHLGTTGPRHVKALAARFGEKGIDTLDAPMSGGAARAATGTLSTMLSGPANARGTAMESLRCYSSTVTNLGDLPGAAQAAKLINNMLSAANFATAVEGLIVASKAGLDISGLTELLLGSTGGSYAFETKVREQVLTRKFNFGGALHIIRKDMDAWKEMADDLGVDCPLSRAVRDIYLQAIKALNDNDDMTDVARYYERLNGVVIAKTTDDGK